MRTKDSLIEFNKPNGNFLKTFRKNSMEMTMFDVKEGGEAIIIRNKKKAVLLDAGGGKEIQNEKLGKILRRFLKSKKHNAKLVAIILSHNHKDHLNAIAPMLDVNDVSGFVSDNCKFFSNDADRNINFFNEMIDKIDIAQITHKRIGLWKKASISNWGKKPIRLFTGPLKGTSKHYRSIMTLVSFGDAKFLFTGDVYKAHERKLIKDNRTKGFLKNIDVFKVTHHGSNGGTSTQFIDHTEPGIFITSSQGDKDHDLGDKTRERIETYIYDKDEEKKKHDFQFGYEPLFNTLWEGKISIKTDGKKITMDEINGILFEVKTQRRA